MPNISRGQLAVKWFETRQDRVMKKIAPQEALTRLGSKEMRDCRPWSTHDDHRVRVAYRKLGARALGTELGRNFKTVQNRARVLGIAERRP